MKYFCRACGKSLDDKRNTRFCDRVCYRALVSKVTPKILAKIKADRAKGLSLAKVAERNGVSAKVVFRIVSPKAQKPRVEATT